MTFTFRPAVREQTSTLIALSGPSGSGKTFSALRLARGLVGPQGKIAFIDTEAGRAKHYADRFKFDHGDMTPPFRPERFVEAIVSAEKAGYGAIVIDSFSHEYEGVGGIMEWADELEERGVKSPGNWKEPKQSHRHLMNRLLQCRSHLIFCLRADEKIKIERINGKTAVIPLGWVPITEKRFMYEMTASFLMRPDKPGIGDPIKLQDQHKPCFPAGALIDEAAGERLAAWARGGAKAPAAEPEVEAPSTQPDASKVETTKEITARIRNGMNAAANAEALDDYMDSVRETRKLLSDKQNEFLDNHYTKKREELS